MFIRVISGILVLLLCTAGLLNCGKAEPMIRTLFDFESDSDLDQLHWRCHTLYSLSKEHATHGERSLMVEIFPTSYAGFIPKLRMNDWSGFNELRFDIFNPEKDNLIISIRIDDKKDYPKYEDRYNARYSLVPGNNEISLPLKALETSGTNRLIDVSKVHRLYIYIKNPDKREVFYLDYVRLHK